MCVGVCDQRVNLLQLELAPQYSLVAHDGSFDRLYISCLRERCAGATSFNQRVENPPDSSRR